ncbi:MAG: DCC1-like thiol-disulfide oxidoreductase family protein [Gemmatimonadota bacterium]|nr:DCC1-like thiol-disulfide oxidoreductase family protein [Gemmatimonadota bacterium]
MGEPEPPLVLFDGVCNLCNSAVQWLVERDGDGRLRYPFLQWQAAAAALITAGIDDPGRPSQTASS